MKEPSPSTLLHDAAKRYADEDSESPIRGAIFWLVDDLFYAGTLTSEAYDEIYWRVHALTVDECVAICRDHGADI